MKTKISHIVVATCLMIALGYVTALAQPDDPTQCIASSFTLNASAATVDNGGQVSIYANFQPNQSGHCPPGGTITVNKGATSVATNPVLPTDAKIPECDGFIDAPCLYTGQILVGTYTLTHIQGSAQQITFNITSITGGHTAGSGVTVTVNP